MAEATRLKDMAAKINTIITVMVHREERLLPVMDERDERMMLLE